MKLNEDMVVIGRKVVLVPYKKHHVGRYHEWMKSPELLEKTASEPLSLEEEHSMQEKWWLDVDKCTFIVLNKEELSKHVEEGGNLKRELYAMVGDVNLFLNNTDNPAEAELELMIAETSSRGMGFGKESAKLMMYFGIKYLGIKKFVVKIGSTNIPSISLFKKFGFVLESHSQVFDESTYCLCCDSEHYKHIHEIECYFLTNTYNSFRDGGISIC